MTFTQHLFHFLRQHRRARVVTIAVAAAALLGMMQLVFLARSERAGAAPNVTCGQVLVASVTLNTDLTCSGNGLVVGKSGITINLNLHTITGDGDPGDFGIYKPVGFATVKVTNGSIKTFDVGVRIIGGVSNRVEKTRLSDSNSGVIADGSVASSVFTANTAFSNDFGIVVAGDKNQITNNNLRSNDGGAGGAGILITGGLSNVVTGNKAVSNRYGIFVAPTASLTQVKSNTANGSTINGLDISDAKATLTSNIANFNTGLGIKTHPGSIDGTANKAHGNGDLHQCENIVCA